MAKFKFIVNFIGGFLLFVRADIEYQNPVGQNNYAIINNYGDYNEPRNFPEGNYESKGESPENIPIEDTDWRKPENLGEVTGVTLDRYGRLVIFHRGNRKWTNATFSVDNVYQEESRGPIVGNTVLTLNPETGEIINGFGDYTFYLPHGIHGDTRGHIWLTDVALQQVFKYDDFGNLLLSLGERFVPGSDLQHFCQPTSVAVADTGEIVIADGYCNSRLMIYDREGYPKFAIGQPYVTFRIPHGLTILRNKEICIADRGNARIVCIDADIRGSIGKFYRQPRSIRHYRLDQIYAITSHENLIYGVSSAKAGINHGDGFTVDPMREKFIDVWGPRFKTFKNPHGIAIDRQGTALYVSEIGPNYVWKFNIFPRNLTKFPSF